MSNENASRSLWSAVLARNESRAISLLEDGADPNYAFEGYPVLIAALDRRLSLPLLRALLDAGASVSLATSDGQTPLSTAAGNGHLAECEELIKRGAALDQCGSQGQSPLGCAISSLRLGVFNYLLEAGADIHQVDNRGFTALHVAAGTFPQDEAIPMVEALVARGASPSCKTDARADFLTPFQYSVWGGADRIAAYFIEECGESPEQVAAGGLTMLDLTEDEDTRKVIRSALAMQAIAAELSKGDLLDAGIPRPT